jgi:hypothetical protein
MNRLLTNQDFRKFEKLEESLWLRLRRALGSLLQTSKVTLLLGLFYLYLGYPRLNTAVGADLRCW